MSEGANIRVRAGGRSDAGRVRAANEDRVLVEPALGVFVVADGMGGHATGQVASAMVAASMRNFFEATVGVSFAPEGPDDVGLAASSLRLVQAVRKANRDIFEAAARHPEHKGMGSTVVAAHVDGARTTVAHVGDSRCYRIRNGALEQLTTDHSLYAEAVRQRPDISAEELALLPKNVITRALGLRPDVKVDAYEVSLVPGDLLLLCSDGLHGMIDDAAIVGAATIHEDLGAACDLLVTLANEAGGHDNVSVVLVRALEEPAIQTVEIVVDDPVPPRAPVTDVGAPRCGGCGTTVIPGNAFCNECGRRLDP